MFSVFSKIINGGAKTLAADLFCENDIKDSLNCRKVKRYNNEPEYLTSEDIVYKLT